MTKLVLTILALLALFSVLRAYPEATPGLVRGVELHPGLVEVGDGTATLGIGFGVMEKSASQGSFWNLLPLRIVYTTGNRSVSIGLNGLSFLLRGGMNVGRLLTVDAPRSGDVISIGGRVVVNSRVDGDVWTLGADVELGPGAVVVGDVVALGGKVTNPSGRAAVGGTVSQLPDLKIPFLGVLGTQFSAQELGFGRHLLGYVLLGFALFLSTFYLPAHSQALYQAMGPSWRPALLTLALSVVLIPLLVVLLVISVIGVFFLPIVVFLVVLAALDGFLLLCARFGTLLRGRSASSVEPMHIFTSGLLGLFLIKLPALAGIILTLLRSPAAAKVGQGLQMLTLIIVVAGLLYGFGASLAHARVRQAK
jgi:hypothetical protein